MADLRLLDKSEFLTCFTQPMSKVTEGTPIDVWPYVDAILQKDPPYQVYDVAHVYRDTMRRYDQILIQTDTKNIFSRDRCRSQTKNIFGYHWLNLNKEYSLED